METMKEGIIYKESIFKTSSNTSQSKFWGAYDTNGHTPSPLTVFLKLNGRIAWEPINCTIQPT